MWIRFLLVVTMMAGAMCAERPELSAVRYLEQRYPFRDAEARRSLASAGNLHEIKDWEISRKLRRYDLFYFRSTWGSSPPAYDIVAVEKGGKLLRISETKDLNTLITEENLAPATDKDARDLAIFCLQVTNITAVVNYGLKDGIRIVSSVDDIPFASNEERKTVASKVQIVAPSIESIGGGEFRYSVFSWQLEGSGAIDLRRIIVGPKGLVSSENKVLLWGVGMFEGLQ